MGRYAFLEETKGREEYVGSCIGRVDLARRLRVKRGKVFCGTSLGQCGLRNLKKQMSTIQV